MRAPADLGYRTDFIFHRHDGAITRHADHWIVRTPRNPSYWFGNYILFDHAPTGPATFARWSALHQRTFGDTLGHCVFGWDDEREGHLAPFLAAGFERCHSLVLALDAPPPAVRLNPTLDVRPIRTDAEWAAVTAQQLLVDRVDFAHPDDGGVFRRQQIRDIRRMVANGRGHWWGAFDHDHLVGAMGLFFDEDHTVGRFQYVTTHPDHRRQRVCTTLLDGCVRHAFTTVAPRQLVIATGFEDDNAAIPAYRRFGFQDVSPSYALKRIG